MTVFLHPDIDRLEAYCSWFVHSSVTKLTLPLKCTYFDESFSNLVCMLPVLSSTSCQILRSLGQRLRSQGSWLKSQNHLFASKMHTVWYIILQLGMHVTCDDFCILSKVKVKDQGHRGHGCRGGIVFRKHILFQVVFNMATFLSINVMNGSMP